MNNPYDWTGYTPQVNLPRTALLDESLRHLTAGRGLTLLGGRGMGKSVFLKQVEQALCARAGVTVLLFRGPPLARTLDGALRELARRLGVVPGSDDDVVAVLRACFALHPETKVIVLLFDEVDQYADADALVGKIWFNKLEEARKELPARLGILAAGGLGIFILRDVLGSPFTSRAKRLVMDPFTESDLRELAAPFEVAARPLSSEVLQALQLATGGNPALVTYGLQTLWEEPVAGLHEITAHFARFRTDHSDFVDCVHRAITHPAWSEIALQVWERLNENGGVVARRELMGLSPGRFMRINDALWLLRAAGLIVLEGSVDADPVHARPVASLLNLPTTSMVERPGGTCAERLAADLVTLLSRIQAFGADWFHQGVKQGDKRLVPEAVFSAILAIGLQCLGWQVEREALQGAGRTDLKLLWPRTGQRSLVEVKIWGRNDYKDIHQQVVGYLLPRGAFAAAAAVMICDREIAEWTLSYQRECLMGILSEEETSAPLSGRFTARSTSPEGDALTVQHLLVRVPRA